MAAAKRRRRVLPINPRVGVGYFYEPQKSFDAVTIYIGGRSITDRQWLGLVELFKGAAKEAGVKWRRLNKYGLKKSFPRKGVSHTAEIKLGLNHCRTPEQKEFLRPYKEEALENLAKILEAKIKKSPILAIGNS